MFAAKTARRVFDRLNTNASSAKSSNRLLLQLASSTAAAVGISSFAISKAKSELRVHADSDLQKYNSATNPLGLFPGDDPLPKQLSQEETQSLAASFANPAAMGGLDAAVGIDEVAANDVTIVQEKTPLTNPGTYDRVEDLAKAILMPQPVHGVKVSIGLVPDSSAFKSSQVQGSFHVEPRDLEAEKQRAMMAMMSGMPAAPVAPGNYNFKWGSNAQVVMQQLGHIIIAQRDDDGRITARYMYLQPSGHAAATLLMDPQSPGADVYVAEATINGDDNSLTGKYVSTETHTAISSTYMQAVTPVISVGTSIDHVPAAGRTMISLKGAYKSLPEVNPQTQEQGVSKTLVALTLGMNGTATVTGFHQVLPQAAVAAEMEANVLSGEYQLTVAGNLRNDLHDTTVALSSTLDATITTDVPINPLLTVGGSAAYDGGAGKTRLGLEFKIGAAR